MEILGKFRKWDWMHGQLIKIQGMWRISETKTKMGKESEREKERRKNRNGRDYLEAQRNKEPLRDHEGNIEWKDPFKSGN